MFRQPAGVVGANAYKVGEKPYPISQASARALVEAARRMAARPAIQAAPVPKPVDPELLKARAEAESVRREAQSKLAQANIKAEEIRKNAEKAAEAAEQKAREEGYAQGLSQGSAEGYDEGLKKGEEEGLGRWAELVARWHSLLEATLKEKENYLADRERILVELVMKVSAKVLGREVMMRGSDIQARVTEAVKRANDRASLVVRLNPEDLAKALEAESGSFRSVQGVKQIEFLADERIMRGGVRVESGMETIDAGMDTQLSEIVRGLLQEAYHAD